MKHASLIAAVLLCLSGLSYVLNDTVTKLLIDRYDVSVIIMTRSLLALPVLYALHARASRQMILRSSNLRLHAVRGAFGLIAAYLYIASLGALSLAEATVILFLSPVFITVMARLILREDVSRRSWLSVGLCFCGVILAIQPGSASARPEVLLVALSALLYAANAINARWIPQQDSLWVIAFFGSLFSALFIAPVAWTTWSGIEPADIPLFLGAAAFSSAGIGLGAIAYRMASAAFLAPFGYSGLIWSFGMTWIIWGLVPGPASLLGGAVIVASVLYNLQPLPTRSKAKMANSNAESP